jgi:hypothetical protein
MAYVNGADQWSKDKIREEIRRRERETPDIRETEKRDLTIESTGYRNAHPGWSSRLYEELGDLEGEVEYLTSIL